MDRDLFEQECKDGDQICAALGVERTEGGRLNIPKMLAVIRDLRSCSSVEPVAWLVCKPHWLTAMPKITVADKETPNARPVYLHPTPPCV